MYRITIDYDELKITSQFEIIFKCKCCGSEIRQTFSKPVTNNDGNSIASRMGKDAAQKQCANSNCSQTYSFFLDGDIYECDIFIDELGENAHVNIIPVSRGTT